MVALPSGSSDGFRRPDWRPRSFRSPPPHVQAGLAQADGPVCLVCTRIFTPDELADGHVLHLGVSMGGPSVRLPPDLVVPPVSLGRHCRWNHEGRFVVRRDLPKKRGTISWDGLAFGEHPMTFHRTGDFFQRERWYGEKHRMRVRLLREETLDNARLLVIAVELDGSLTRDHPHFNRELLFRVNLLQEVIGGAFPLPAGYGDDDLLALTFVAWKLLPPDLRSSDVLRMLGKTRSKQEKLALIERLAFIKQRCPEVEIKVGEGGFGGYFLAKVRDDCVIAEHLTPGNAIYIFDHRWPDLSRISRRRLVEEQPAGFRRLEHRGDWQGTIATVIDSARNSH